MDVQRGKKLVEKLAWTSTGLKAKLLAAQMELYWACWLGVRWVVLTVRWLEVLVVVPLDKMSTVLSSGMQKAHCWGGC